VQGYLTIGIEKGHDDALLTHNVGQLSEKLLLHSEMDATKNTSTHRDLETAGFVNRGGKGDHRNFVHPKVTKPITISGKLGKDAKHYQEKAVQMAIEESKR